MLRMLFVRVQGMRAVELLISFPLPSPFDATPAPSSCLPACASIYVAQVELKGMADRIISMRQQLYDALLEGAPPPREGWVRQGSRSSERASGGRQSCHPHLRPLFS